jgi:hypothetical protein
MPTHNCDSSSPERKFQMLTKSLSKDFINYKALAWMVAASAAISLAILNRWVVTPLGVKSFGRVWQYYGSWFDFGFHRRGLVGTVLTETGLNRLVLNEYLFAYMFYGLFLVAGYFLVIKFIISNKNLRANNVLSFCVLFSPATFLHFAYSTGCQDLILFVLLLVAVFFVQSALALSLVVVSGVLVHELFIFMLPGIFILKFLGRTPPTGRLNRNFVVPAIAALVAVVAVTTVGRLAVDASTYEAVMAERMPSAAYQHGLWSGYFEVASTIESNTSLPGQVFSSLWVNRWYLLVSTVYAFFVACIVAWYLKANAFHKILTFTAITFPLLTTFVAGDYHRWASISACLGIVGMLLLTAQGKLIIPKMALVLLTFFSVFAPFGSAELERPFPMHQFILERLMR